MRVLDLNNKSVWLAQNTTDVEDGIILKQNGKISTPLNGSGKLSLKMVSKNISGSGDLSIRILDNKENIIFMKDLTFTSKSWAEKSLNLNISEKSRGANLQIFRPKGSFGRLQIGRVIVDGEPAVIPKKKQIEKAYTTRILASKESPKRLAVIIPYGIYGGGEIYLKNLFSNLDNPFVTDFIFLSNNPLKHKLPNDKINTVVANSLPQVNAILMSNNYDTIIYYNSRRVYNIISALKADKSITSEIIEIYHSNFIWNDAIALNKTRVGVDRIFRVSHTLCNDISGVDSIETVRVGIDTDLFKRKNKEKSSDQRVHFGMVARLSAEKNIKYAIDLIASKKDTKLSVAGDGPLRLALTKYIKENNIDNIELLGHIDDISEKLNNFDAFILTSRMEGTPISILEAMSFGIPIFSTDVGAIRANFGHLDNFHFLTENLIEDKKILNNAAKNCYFENLREYILEYHNIKLNSNLFFNLLLKSVLQSVPAEEEKTMLSGTFY